MKNITLPKKPHKGIKIFCKDCRINNPRCNHKDRLVYRVIVKIPGGGGSVRTKMLKADNYDDAVVEAIQFRKELAENNYEVSKPQLDEGNDFSVTGAILKYYQFLRGDTEYAHLQKNLTPAYCEEIIRYCKIFAKNLKKKQDIDRMRITDVNKKHTGNFYSFLKTKYSPKTFNKCMNALRGFFDYLIKIEEVKMTNPFEIFTPQVIPNSNIETITREEFEAIINAVDTYTPTMILGKKEKKVNMYFPWLKDGFRLFLLTGGRREEIIDLKWSDIYVSEQGVKFFMFENLKVSRINKTKITPKKYVPINVDLEDLLIKLGLNDNKNPNDYILFPERKCSTLSIMDKLSKAFTYYKNGANIKKDISLKNLRKTYISWVNQALGNQTGVLTSHSTQEILEKFYLDPKIISIIEKGAMEIKIFGTDNTTKQIEKRTNQDDRK